MQCREGSGYLHHYEKASLYRHAHEVRLCSASFIYYIFFFCCKFLILYCLNGLLFLRGTAAALRAVRASEARAPRRRGIRRACRPPRGISERSFAA